MIKIGIALFLILHGLVHLLYLGQSRCLFELQPDMEWPDDFARLPVLPFPDGHAC